MKLDPQMKALLDKAAASGSRPFYQMEPEQARPAFEKLLRSLAGEPEPVAQVSQRLVSTPNGEVPVRIYTPHGAGPFPALVFFHGGGWVLGSLDSHDGLCRSLTNGARCVTVSVEYRLAPEHKFPAAADDCYHVTRWLAENAADTGCDGSRIAVGGDSAGGNLAAAVSLMARDRGAPRLRYQLLIYPAIDDTLDYPSQAQFAQDGYILSRIEMDWFWKNYLRGKQDSSNPYACPSRAKNLAELPPALIITAEFDPLRDEGEVYAARLRKAGVPAECIRYDGVTHGFLCMTTWLDKSKRATAEAANALAAALLA